MKIPRPLLTLLAAAAALVLLLPMSAPGGADTAQQQAGASRAVGSLISVLDRGQTVDTVTIAYRYAFTGGLYGIKIYDVRRPGSPKRLVHLTGWIRGTAVRGNYAYAQEGSGPDSSVAVLDIDGPVTPVYWITPPGVPRVAPFQPSFTGPIVIRGPYLYAIYEDFYNPDTIYQGMAIYSLRNPRQPQLLGRVRLHTTTSINRLALRGDYAYIGGLRGLETVNVDDVRNPRRTWFRVIPSRGLAVNGRYLFSGNPINDGTVRVYGLTRPYRPKYLGTIWGPADLAATDDVQVAHPSGRRDYLLVAWNTTPSDFEWVHVYDITAPLRLGKRSLLRDEGKLRGITSNRVNDITVAGPVVYVAQGYAGVRVVKVNWAKLAR